MTENYDTQYYAAINDKLQNKKALLNKKIDLSSKENKLTNKLLRYYDNNFNSYYDENQRLNNEIENKEKIIKINNDAFNKKLDSISLIKYFFTLLLFIIIITFGHYYNLYSATTMRYIFIFGFMLYIIIIYYEIYYGKYTRGQYLANKFAYDSTSSIFKKAAREILPNYMTRDRCPKDCKPKKPPSRCPKNMPNCREIDPSRVRAMSTDSTLNDWKFGDILYQKCSVYQPSYHEKKLLENKYKMSLNDKLLKCPLKEPFIDRKTGEEIDYILFNTPEPWYPGIKDNVHSNTVYTCKWSGIGDPIGDQGSEFSGYIPCKYYPGYETKDIQIGNESVKKN